jgi:pilus assembly protein CpaF
MIGRLSSRAAAEARAFPAGRRREHVCTVRTVEDAVDYVRSRVADAESEEWLDVFRDAQAREPGADRKCVDIVLELLADPLCEVEWPGPRDRLAWEVYKELWGLGPLEEVYRDPEVDEIRVGGVDRVYAERRGRTERLDVRFRDEQQIVTLIQRLHIRDRVMATARTPFVESVLRDGTRLTATLPPLTPQGPTFILRKHGTFEITKENYVARGTMNDRLHDMLAVLAKGQANTLIIGPPDSGKTTLARYLVRFYHESLRLVSMETDVELRLNRWYPDRDVTEFEAQPDLGLSMKEIFPVILRYSPDMVFLGEVRRREELEEAINAAVRGHSGCVATVHYLTLEQAMYHMGMMFVAAGHTMTVGQAEAWVASAWDVGVVMFESGVVGRKIVERVAEIVPAKDHVEFRDLAVWRPHPEKGYWAGDWEFPSAPSERLRAKLARYGVTRDDLKAAGWEV